MTSHIVAFLGTKKDDSRRSKPVNSRRDKKLISHYSTRIINLKEDFALTFKLRSGRFGQISALTKPYLRNELYRNTQATLKNGFYKVFTEQRPLLLRYFENLNAMT